MKLLTWAGVGLFLCLNGFADEKARLIDVSHYKIRWEIDPAKNPDHFTGQVTVTLQTKVATNRISLDAEELEIEKVVAEKPKGSVSFTLKKNELLIDFPKALPKNATAQFTVYYKGKVRTDHTGLSKVFDPDEPERGPIFFTQFESQDARKFFPCNDDPSDKATTEVVTFLPERYEALSNGERGKDRYLKVGGERWREIPWALNEPHSTYLVAVAVGPFGSLSLPFGKKEAAVWVAKTKLDKARFTSTVTKDLIGYYEKLLAIPYPWKKYFTVGIPTFLWGGMENTSITFMNEERILLNDPRSEFEKKRIVSLVAHELAHQWFGDYVTLKGWEDLWLNESFASYFGTRATENYFKTEEEHLDVTLNTWDSYFREEDGPRSHPIVNVGAPNPDDAFDSTSYTKGENVLRMLHFYLGENAFTKGITGYLKKHAYSNATYKDFFKSMEVASGQNLTAFRDSWLLNRGYPILTYGGTWDSKANTFTFHLQQNPNHAEDGTLFHFKIPVVFHRTSSPAYGKALVVLMDKKEFQEKVVLPAEPEWISINPKAEVLAKVRQETEDEKSLSSQALFDPDLTARVWALTELSSDLNEGKTISSASERTLIQSLKTDPSPYVRMAVLQNILRMKSRWLPDALGAAIFGIAKSKVTQDHDLASSDSDTHGWTEWKSTVLGALGKVEDKAVVPFLASKLSRQDLSLDDLKMVARAAAMQGSPQSAGLLKTALQLHGTRGYAYRFTLRHAFGYLESVVAVGEIRDFAKTEGTDLFARLGGAVQYNETLKTAPEWAGFLLEFLTQDTRFGETVKFRLLETVEETKTAAVKEMLDKVATQSRSERLQGAAKKILNKNFSPAAQLGTGVGSKTQTQNL